MTVDIDGISLYYEKTGQGRPVIMLHGNGEDGTIFGKLAGKLSKHFTLYILDSRNHGRSGKSEDFSYEAMAGDVTKFVFALNLDKPYVVGFSDGAIIAMIAQMKEPGLFGRLALLGANLHPRDFRHEIYMEMEGAYHLKQDPLLKLMLTQPDINPLDLWRIREPVLVTGAENDIYRPDTFTKITDALPAARMKIIYGHDHGSYVIDSDLLYEPLLNFFII